MPEYSFVCPDGHSQNIVLHFEDCDLPQKCVECGKPLRRQMATGLSVIWGGRWRDQWRDSPRERGGISDGLGPQAE